MHLSQNALGHTTIDGSGNLLLSKNLSWVSFTPPVSNLHITNWYSVSCRSKLSATIAILRFIWL